MAIHKPPLNHLAGRDENISSDQVWVFFFYKFLNNNSMTTGKRKSKLDCFFDVFLIFSDYRSPF